MRGGAAKARLQAEVAGRALDHLPDRRGVVEHEAEPAAKPPDVEHAGTGERALLPDGEQQLELHRRARGVERAGEREQHHHGGLVVGAEDALVGVFPDPLVEHGLDRRLRRHRVEMGAEHQRPSRRAGGAPAPLRPAGARAGCRSRSPSAARRRPGTVSMPRARSSAITRSPQPRSLPEGLSIRHSSANVPLR